MSKDILLEIGTEEVPAHAMPGILRQLREAAATALQEAHIPFDAVRTVGTPRRLALLVTAAAEMQDAVTTVHKGPSAQIAYAADGTPTKAALGFARGLGLDVTALRVQEGYVFAEVTHTGEATKTLLPSLLPALIQHLSFPNSMRWGRETFRFIRPIRWLVALFGEEVIPFTLAGVTTGRRSRGHRFLGDGDFDIPSAQAYEATARDHFLMVDPKERETYIQHELCRELAAAGAKQTVDPVLLEEVVYLVEYPTVLCGSFDEAYLQLPEAVIITPMKDHQRYFPMYSAATGRLMNRFLTVRNGDARYLDTVRHGNERVLRARLDDAKFFFTEDRKQSLWAHVESLRHIVFQNGLGTLYDKALRLQKLTVYLNHSLQLGLEDAQLERACLLAKADLSTQMVMEFTELQGVMGKEYAKLDGESEAVAEALQEQYLPRYAGDDLPQTVMGSVLSVADKIDTLVGMFRLGKLPTGSQDPYALRRQTIGVLHILLQRQWDADMATLLDAAAAGYEAADEAAGDVRKQLEAFIALRLKNIFQDRGHEASLIEGAMAGHPLNAMQGQRRVEALETARRLKQEDLLQAYTRVGNMVREDMPTHVTEALFTAAAERDLWAVCRQMEAALPAVYAAYDFEAALRILRTGMDAIRTFLDTVRVLDENPAIRDNRLHLLARVYALIRPFGDIRKVKN